MPRWVDDTEDLDVITPDGTELVRVAKNGASKAVPISALADADLAAHVAASDPHPQYLKEATARDELGLDTNDDVTFKSVTVDDAAYDATTWNGSTAVPTRNAVRDKIASLAQADIAGLTTADSPQFSAINLGNATDTTLARVAAGRMSVEGREIMLRHGHSVDVSDPQFGATGNAVATDGGVTGTDDTAAFQAAIDYVYGLGGGEVTFGKRHLIDGDLNIKRGVRLRGHLARPGFLPPVAGFSYGDVAGVLFLNSSYPIRIQQRAGITNCTIIRKGLVAPITTDGDATTAIAAFAGTAVMIEDHGAEADSLLILGFARALSTDAAADPSRIKVTQVHFDCTAGLLIDGNYDTSEIRQNRGWPYLTAHLSNTTWTRSGAAFSTGENYDWGKFSECFSYGYAYGFYIVDADDVSLIGCGSDYVPGVTSTSVGVYLGSGTLKGTLLGYQAAAQGRGVVIENGLSSAEGGMVSIIGSNFWGCDDACIDVITGRASIEGCHLRGPGGSVAGGIGVRAASTAGALIITQNEFEYLTTPLSIHATPLALASTTIHSNGNNGSTNSLSSDKISLRGSTAASAPLQILNSADSASVQVGRRRGLRATPANNDTLYEDWELADSAGNTTIALRQSVRLTNVTDGAEAAQVFWGIMTGGALTDRLLFTPTVLSPVTNDAMVLGTSSLGWADLYLASGGVINWNNGNATITHSSGNLTTNVPLTFPSYTVAGLPTGAAGRTAFASNGRKNGEGAGAGTGVLVFHDGTAWRACDTGATVAA